MANLSGKARKPPPAPKSESGHKGRISGAAERSIDRKADRVIARVSEHKSPR